MSFVKVRLGDKLEGSVHGKNRGAGVDGFDAPFGHVLGNRSAAAHVDLAQLAKLPGDVVFGKCLTELGQGFSRSIAGARLAAAAGVFADGDTAVDVGGVAAFVNLGEGRIESGGYVAGEAEGVIQAGVEAPAVIPTVSAPRKKSASSSEALSTRITFPQCSRQISASRPVLELFASPTTTIA